MISNNLKQYVDYILSFFERANCSVGQGLFLVRTLNATAPKQGYSYEDIEILNRLVFNLYLNRFIDTDEEYYFFKLLENGYNYIQGDNEISIHAYLSNIVNCQKDERTLFSDIWLMIGKEEKAPFYVPDVVVYQSFIPFLEEKHLSFGAYIQQRIEHSCSTSRIVWLKELLDRLPKEHWQDFVTTLSENIDKYYYQRATTLAVNDYYASEPNSVKQCKRIFISYTHENSEHNAWVMQLAEALKKNHLEVIIDQELPLGREWTKFMEEAVTQSDKTLMILTPTYKQKADNREAGVGYESQFITHDIWENTDVLKYIPIIRKGTYKESYPVFLGTRNGLDMTDNALYTKNLQRLIEELQKY